MRRHRDEQQAAIDVARAKTEAFYQAVKAMTDAGADILKEIKAKGATDPSVFPIAQVPSPATPSPVPAPSTPDRFRVEVRQDGALIVTWKCTTARGAGGTVYNVSRRIGPTAGAAAGPFVFVATVGTKTFTDLTLPENSGPVTYQVVAVRSTSQSNPGQFTVAFGTGSTGEVTASIVTPTPRIAA